MSFFDDLHDRSVQPNILVVLLVMCIRRKIHGFELGITELKVIKVITGGVEGEIDPSPAQTKIPKVVMQQVLDFCGRPQDALATTSRQREFQSTHQDML